MNIKYVVVKIDLPEYETGEFKVIDEFDDMEQAVIVAEKLDGLDEENWHEVVVRRRT